METKHYFGIVNLIVTAQWLCEAANRDKPVSEIGPFGSLPATALRSGPEARSEMEPSLIF